MRKVNGTTICAAACSHSTLMCNTALFGDLFGKGDKTGMCHHASVTETNLHTFFQSTLCFVFRHKRIVSRCAFQTNGEGRLYALRGNFCAAKPHFFLCRESAHHVNIERLGRQATQNFNDPGAAQTAVECLAHQKACLFLISAIDFGRNGQAQIKP